LDTSALLFWSFDPESLSVQARHTIKNARTLVVSSISLWEIAIKHKQKRLHLPLDPADYAARLGQIAKVSIVPVEVQTWLANVNLAWEHKDPADRTIVATAQERKCPLVTSDQEIRKFYPLAVW
jgi:PIN domain nuclease of toxin-antitoxin system